jgi:hypothetical protein
MPDSEPPKPPVGEPMQYGHDYGSSERARMRAGEPKKNVVNPSPKEPPKPPVVQK